MRDPFHLRHTTNQRVDTAGTRLLVEVGGIGIQRAFFGLFRRRTVAGLLASGPTLPVFGHAGNTVGNEVHDIKTRDALRLEEVHRLAFLLTENGHQHVGAGDFAAAGGLYVKHGALQYPLEPQGRLRFPVITVFGDQRRGRVHEFHEISAQGVDFCAAGLEYANGVVIVQQCEQQMLDCHELVALAPGLAKGLVEGQLQILAQHTLPLPGYSPSDASISHNSGC